MGYFAVECNLTLDKLDFCKKRNTNTKVDVHLPHLEKDCFDEKEEATDLNKEYSNNETGIKSIESQILLDINFDLKQKSRPIQFSHTRYESKYTYPTLEIKDYKIESNSEENATTDRIPTVEHCGHIGDYEPINANYIDGNNVNPALQTIIRRIEELMSHSTTGVNIHTNTCTDESVQFPVEIYCGSAHRLASKMLLESGKDNSTTQVDIGHQVPEPICEYLENEDPPIMLEHVKSDNNSELQNENSMDINYEIGKMESEAQSRPISVEMPHEEIKQLHHYLMDMIFQVDILKNTISEMKAEQEKTEFDLKSKEKNIGKLAEEIQQLRELRSIPSLELEKITGSSKICFEAAEKDTNSIKTYKEMQKATEENIKKIAGKLKHIQESKSKSSMSVHSLEKKSSRSSSKSNKSDRKKITEKSLTKKSEKKIHKTAEPKKKNGIGNGDSIDNPFFRGVGLIQKKCEPENTLQNELDELD